MSRLTLFFVALLSFGGATAHHSVTALYSSDVVSEVDGKLTEIFWRNPHVRLWVQSDDGEVWELESGSTNTLERLGITSDLLSVGARVRLAGSTHKSKERAFYATNIQLPDGREAVLGSGPPRWSDRVIAVSSVRAPLDIPEAVANAARRAANGIFRVWSRSGAPESAAEFTASAQTARDQWVPLRDDPTLRCIAPGMIEAMVSPYPIQLIQNGADEIIVRMEEWDGERRIHMNATEAADSIAPSKMGYSVGHWEGSTLVVETDRINWPYFDSRGAPQSGDVRMVERFAMSSDERNLSWSVTITDQLNLVRPATVTQEYVWVPGDQIKPFNCANPDQPEN